jgi:hypothetical protein
MCRSLVAQGAGGADGVGVCVGVTTGAGLAPELEGAALGMEEAEAAAEAPGADTAAIPRNIPAQYATRTKARMSHPYPRDP